MNEVGRPVESKMSVLAILAFILAFVCGPVGLVLGVIAAISIARSGRRLRGIGLAIAAIPVSIAFAGILAATSIPSFVNYTRKAKTAEATLNVSRCMDSAMAYHSQHGAFPPSSDWTPAGVPGAQKMAPNQAIWSASPWTELGFSMLEPHYYQYQFVNEGHVVYCRARGDLDGDGETSLFQREAVNDGTAYRPSYDVFQENPLE